MTDDKQSTDFGLAAEVLAIRAMVQRLRPWARLGVAVMEGWPDTLGNIDGFELQDMAVGAGVLRDVPGGFDPARHVDDLGVCPERGDPWLEIIRRPSAAALSKGGE